MSNELERLRAERDRLTAELSDLQELLQAILDSTADWLFAKDLEHRFLFVNRSFAAAQGVTPEAMIGRRDSDYWGLDQCEPNPVTGHQGFHTDDRRAFAGETVRNPHDEATLEDGSIRIFDTVKSPLRASDGRITGVLCFSREVTDRERAVTALRESEERFRVVVGNIPGSVYRSEIAPPYRDLFLSAGIAAISGYRAEEYFEPGGPSCGALILAEDLVAVDAAVSAAVAEHRAYRVRYRIRHRDGSIRWVTDQGRAAYAADGTPLFLDGVHLDATAQVEAETSARAKEERLRTILDNEPECVKLLDRDGNLLEMNPAGLRMIEADSLEQVVGLALQSRVDAADRPAFLEMIRGVFDGETRTLTFGLEGLQGGRRILESHSVPLWAGPDHQTVSALLSVTRDVTDAHRAAEALRESEQRFRTLVASVPGAVYLSEVDPPFRDTFMSEGARSLTGYPPEEFLRPDGISWEAITLAEDFPRVAQKIAQGVAARAVISDRYRIRRADGAVRWVMDEARAAYDPSGQPKFLAGVILDITEQRQAEEARQGLESQLRESQKMEAMGTLAGGIAHDFNNLLAAIVGHAELLRQDLPPAGALQGEVAGVLAASRRAQELVQQILTFSRRGELKRAPTALRPVVQEALSLLRSSLPRTIEIRSEIAPQIPDILADPNQMHQVVVNLATNAAHAMRERGGILAVSLGTTQVDDLLARRKGKLHGGLHVRLRVSDTGHGMDRVTLGRIFEPFFTTKIPGEGTGLGLAVVHGIVEAHDGLITVESEPGKGTSFSVYFPAVESSQVEERSAEEAIPRGRGEHLLVLDDEPALVGVASRLLTKLGYRVSTYERPEEALAVLRLAPGQFDLVLSDLTMPGMDGLEFAAQVREIRPDLPFLLTSGYGGAVEGESLARLGIRELLPKPFLLATLARAVHRHLLQRG